MLGLQWLLLCLETVETLGDGSLFTLLFNSFPLPLLPSAMSSHLPALHNDALPKCTRLILPMGSTVWNQRQTRSTGVLPSGENSQYYQTHFLRFSNPARNAKSYSQPATQHSVQRYRLQSPATFALALEDKTGFTNSALSKDLAGT